MIDLADKERTHKGPYIKAVTCVACCHDDNGKPVFTADDIESLVSGSYGLLEKVYRVAARLCGLGEEKN